MSRWTHLIPRIIILFLILTAIWLGRDPLIQKLLIREAQNITGAQVEIAQVHSSISNNKLFFKDLKIADPRNPMKNLVQADMAYVQIDPEHLLRRRLVIKQGQTSELIFGAPRTASGALPEIPPTSNNVAEIATTPKRPNDDYKTEVVKTGQEWLDQLPASQPAVETDEFEIVKLARESQQRWEQKLDLHRSEVARIKPAIANLQNILSTNSGNPLREADRYSRAQLELKRLEGEASQIRKNIRALQAQVSKDKHVLMQAKTRDQQKLRQLPRRNLFDSQKLSKLLLYQSQAQMVDEVVQWFRWFRTAVPDPYQHLNPRSIRGVNVAFDGVEPQPGFLIEQLDLEGEGRFAGQHLNFAGTAFNLTTQPRLHSKPASFELRAQGNQHVIIKCEIDRRDPVPVDNLRIQCPDLEKSDEQTLGHDNSMLVSMGPGSRVQAEIDIQMNGDQLSGMLIFRHSQVSLHVDKLHELAGGPDTALRLNQDLASINQFNTKVQLGGSLDDYQFTFESDLGSRFAATADKVVNTTFEQNLVRRKSRLEEISNTAIEQLDRSISGELAELAEQLQQESFRMAELKESIETRSTRNWPKTRR